MILDPGIPYHAKRLVQAVARLEQLVVALMALTSLVSCLNILCWSVVIDELYGRLLFIGARIHTFCFFKVPIRRI